MSGEVKTFLFVRLGLVPENFHLYRHHAQHGLHYLYRL